MLGIAQCDRRRHDLFLLRQRSARGADAHPGIAGSGEQCGQYGGGCGADLYRRLGNVRAGNNRRNDARRKRQQGDERDIVRIRGRWRPVQHQHPLLVDDINDDGVVQSGKSVRSRLLKAPIVN